MPDRKFLQEFPLYRKFKMKLPETLDEYAANDKDVL